MAGQTRRAEGARALALTERGLRLEYATLGWNVVGCVVVLASAYAARSVALAGFGIDSVIEIFASLVVVWQLKAINDQQQHLAERLIGLAFLLLAAYIGVQSAIVLLVRFQPQISPTGIAWLVLTAAAMFLLAYGKARTGAALGNPVLEKEARVTGVDGLLAVAVLLGLLLHALFGWWWADPVAALVIMAYGLYEGIGSIRSSEPA